ncbi:MULTISPECIES: alpha-ketoglutarate-dependent dioxygenase AlkB family protein [Mycobacteriaceae]|uniref:Alpha-ketoglutarate-dependent dioxygenase AlkB n=2 Tax=Mycolicibacterium TaxID=1866885 RepID=A0A1A0ML89_MYCMU|nr:MULTISPECIES: alpha-ketoglutarate-dependent dioxygenase AlkB [Mycolicibacterium]MCX8556329.1 alpha-ketoglutarate-dependent dioxygenase AlkB [Mycolicibacterium mucogenicum]MDX1880692.1 alpha-ketoglutarate-dependent dioxygenase AlkB [Mycolicibacterium sp. 141076]OBA85836.1 DNA repair protein [Mycolicibacterium mucogenicum]RUP33652.1 MAG: alpha-ketoglutarate-dependent dioxygenase AlkB [Mycolicibacterium sp.]TDK85511.1 alpha-ketoglutarate-dependent dioxygenase AlkB [Mycolicibacterium mucogenicu
MSLAVQGSLFDHAERRWLGDGAWVDVRAGWLTGADTLFDELLTAIPWRAEQRQMYDKVLDVPRLVSFHDLAQDRAPHPGLARLRVRLNDAYAHELGEPFTTVGLCLYRDGNDSVAWHGDTIGRSSTEDTMVAVLSLGATRVFALRPRTTGADGRRTSVRLPQGHGDLLVMGGSCQRTWEHAVPKTARPTGPRISIQFRPRNVR